MIVTIVGLGLMGGSAAIDLKKRGLASHIIGVDHDSINANAAMHIGFVDELLELDDAVKKAELVILAIPVDAALRVLPKILDKVDKQVVTDMCSTKGKLLEWVKYHPKRKQYVAAHPMAGTEFSGPWAAISNLFDGKAVIMCDTEDSDIRALALVKRMFETLNMRVIYMNGANHDVHAAYISHISHISSFALALTVLDKEKNEKHIFDLASGGFDSTVRLAKSSADMWAPIFEQNKENVITVLNTYISKLKEFRKHIENDEPEKIRQLIQDSNRIKRVLFK
ncbi:MAG TPA: prephenate dehydrogenase [Marinilabiliales bacterium]|nr:MAG: prephenate dehydrogenase [Bacteroidetes bacterium GWA2_40_14]OFX60866.1 MAG: prephenate dehydrogenase [Bacteroidetes bacterium GWC2_40_13]OFX71520.1 MAG: prephenate dehydrogenase [Bacteroidetes bacterium GWD2_40_43]OFX95554.1 MAG: prephenate dehydrogenase [Bacteroidetes bacterium GWE2_40_63]OFY22288.1 MAG: prephenate dehydrogenase [Bacteroidetes bacterium GWF2_40_13]OFZ24924.1 MAG: prephenate dehydrogenase [Bacteroidetes bacterium RIFOXYC2_FULL_40_12]HAM99996.1 prephenate dehydrogenas